MTDIVIGGAIGAATGLIFYNWGPEDSRARVFWSVPVAVMAVLILYKWMGWL